MYQNDSEEKNISEGLLIKKTFIFESQSTKEFIIQDVQMRESAMLQEFLALILKYCPAESHWISMYNPDENNFSLINQGEQIISLQIPLSYFQPRNILIRFKKICKNASSQSQKSLDFQRKQKYRNKERTIGESIQLVKQWRNLHLSLNENSNKKISLKQAANKLGISKKSLDDYYYQLRLGQYFSFDFKNNLNQKIGILRAYVKQFKPQRELKNKNLRHPKRLKIIQLSDELIFQEQIMKQISFQEPIKEDLQLLQKLQQEQHNFIKYDTISIQSEEIQFPLLNPQQFDEMNAPISNHFLYNFQFSLDHNIDPFQQFDLVYKKKTIDYPTDDCLFF